MNKLAWITDLNCCFIYSFSCHDIPILATFSDCVWYTLLKIWPLGGTYPVATFITVKIKRLHEYSEAF
jgi:hypothetical protein